MCFAKHFCEFRKLQIQLKKIIVKKCVFLTYKWWNCLKWTNIITPLKRTKNWSSTHFSLQKPHEHHMTKLQQKHDISISHPKGHRCILLLSLTFRSSVATTNAVSERRSSPWVSAAQLVMVTLQSLTQILYVHWWGTVKEMVSRPLNWIFWWNITFFTTIFS